MSATASVTRKLMSRRGLLKTLGVAGGAAVLAACGATPTPQVIKETVVVKETAVVEKEVTKIVEGTPQVVKETVVVEKVVEPTQAPKEPVTIRFSSVGWGGWLSDPWNAIVKDFDASQSAIKVPEYEDVAEGYQKVMAAAAGNAAADVYMFENKYMFGFAARGFFLPLDDFVSASKSVKKDDYFDNDWKECLFRGKQYLVPFDPAPYIIGYNPELLDKAGVKYPPAEFGKWNQNDFLAAAQALTSGEGAQRVFGWSGPSGYMLFNWVWGNGGNMLTDDKTKCVIDQPEAMDALQWAADLVLKYQVAPLPNQVAEGGTEGMFGSGRIAMFHTAPWTTIDLKQYTAKSGLKWNLAAWPDGATGAHIRAPLDSWGIWIGSQHKNEAWTFIEYLASDESLTKLAKAGLLPAKKTVNQSDVFLKQDPQGVNWKVFIDALNGHTHPHPDTAIFQQMMDTFNASWDVIIAGKSTVQVEMPKVAETVNKLLDDCRKQGFCD